MLCLSTLITKDKVFGHFWSHIMMVAQGKEFDGLRLGQGSG